MYLLERTTGGLRVPPGSAPPAAASAADHALLVVSMLLAGMVAMMAGFTVQDRTAGGQVLSSLLLPVPMVLALVLGLLVGPYRVPSLVFLVAVMAVAVYVRRFGPRGFAWGMVGFNGAFLASSSRGARPRRPGLAGRRPRHRRARLAAGALRLLPAAPRAHARPHAPLVGGAGPAAAGAVHGRAGRRRQRGRRGRRGAAVRRAGLLRRQLLRLNESTLIIEAQLGEARPGTAAAEAQRLVDVELALANVARFAAALATTGADAGTRAHGAAAVRALLTDDDVALAAAVRRCGTPRRTARAPPSSPRGWPPPRRTWPRARDRSRRPLTEEDRAATATRSPRPWSWRTATCPARCRSAPRRRRRPGAGDGWTGSPCRRTCARPCRSTVAGAIAVTAGDAVSGKRLYWAVLAVFLAFVAATNSGEQVRRALFRAGGTALGIVVGDLLVHLTGGQLWVSLAIVLVALFLGIYLIRVTTFMAMGITVTMARSMSSSASSAGRCWCCGWPRPRSASPPSSSPCWSSCRCGPSGC